MIDSVLNGPVILDMRKLDFVGYITTDADRTYAVPRSLLSKSDEKDLKKVSDSKSLKCVMSAMLELKA